MTYHAPLRLVADNDTNHPEWPEDVADDDFVTLSLPAEVAESIRRNLENPRPATSATQPPSGFFGRLFSRWI